MNHQKFSPDDNWDHKKPNNFRKLYYSLAMLASILYLLNLGAGVFELIPDNIPLIGNLDEAGALYTLIYCYTQLKNN